MAAPEVTVSPRGAERVRGGHPWIYRSDVVGAEAAAGDLVRVLVEGRRPLGWALWSDASQIAVRMVSGPGGTAGRSRADFDDRAWLSERLAAAIAYRSVLDIDADACRLVHGEADGLPALVVDRYADCLVVQTLCQGMDRRLGLIAELLGEQLQPRGILARNDPKVRGLEGLPQVITLVAGDVPELIEVREGDIRLQADLRHGQKTGLFLDQRENHQAAARYARGRGLDAFTYHGGFALHLARHCDRVMALDSSAAAVEAARANALQNGIANLEVGEANVFDALRELEIAGERFDTIVLDPPAFAKNRAALERAVAGYKEINLRALKLLEPGGVLVTCSCSYHVDEALLVAILEQAAADARAVVTVVEKRLQARDHPVRLGLPETNYLKCLIVRKQSS